MHAQCCGLAVVTRAGGWEKIAGVWGCKAYHTRAWAMVFRAPTAWDLRQRVEKLEKSKFGNWPTQLF